MADVRIVSPEDAPVVLQAGAGDGSSAFDIRKYGDDTYGPVAEGEAGEIVVDGVTYAKESLPSWHLTVGHPSAEGEPARVILRLLRFVEPRRGGFQVYPLDRHDRALKDALGLVARPDPDVWDYLDRTYPVPPVLVDEAVLRQVTGHEPVVVADEEEVRQFAREKWVRIMCDHSAEGVWHEDGSAGQLDALPVSRELRDGIRAWQDIFEKNARDDGSVADDLFGSIGERLAREVKAQLPDWTVIYFDEHAYAKVRGKKDGDRNAFEYEIEAPAPGPKP